MAKLCKIRSNRRWICNSVHPCQMHLHINLLTVTSWLFDELTGSRRNCCMHAETCNLVCTDLLMNPDRVLKIRSIWPTLRVKIRHFHRIHQRKHATDDAGMSKHTLSPYYAYYHNWHTLTFTASDSSSDKRCFLKVLSVQQLTQLAGSILQLSVTLLEKAFS